MAFLDWDQTIALNIDQIDVEHQKLIKLMNAIHDRNNESVNNKEQLADALRALIEYTKIHFSSEEKFMDSFLYPGIDMHKKIHKDLLAKLETISRDFAASDQSTVPESVFLFFKDWLIAHIKGIDTKYASYAKKA